MKYSFFKHITISLFIFSVSVTPLFFVFADQVGGSTLPEGVGIKNPLKGGSSGQGINNVYDLVSFIVNDIVIPFGATIMVLMIIFAGFQFVVAQGNPTKIEEAKTTLFYAIIGSAILLGSWAIAEIIENTVKSITG